MLNLTSQKSDRFLVERISKLIPHWGIKQLSLDALGNYCDQNGIIVKEVDLSDADGYAFYQNDIPHLFFNAKLNYAERVISAYHELAHLLLHTPDPDVFKRQKYCCWNFSKCDRQAEIVGLVAWMPETQARGLSPGALMRQYDVRRESAEFRASLNLWVP